MMDLRLVSKVAGDNSLVWQVQLADGTALCGWYSLQIAFGFFRRAIERAEKNHLRVVGEDRT